MERCGLGQSLQAEQELKWGTSMCKWGGGGGENRQGRETERGGEKYGVRTVRCAGERYVAVSWYAQLP